MSTSGGILQLLFGIKNLSVLVSSLLLSFLSLSVLFHPDTLGI